MKVRLYISSQIKAIPLLAHLINFISRKRVFGDFSVPLPCYLVIRKKTKIPVSFGIPCYMNCIMFVKAMNKEKLISNILGAQNNFLDNMEFSFAFPVSESLQSLDCRGGIHFQLPFSVALENKTIFYILSPFYETYNRAVL